VQCPRSITRWIEGSKTLTVLGLGLSILSINAFAPGENQNGHEYSAAFIYASTRKHS